MKTAQEEAVDWYARLQSPDCRLEERAQFKHWLEQHPGNTEAYASVERLVRDLDSYSRNDPKMRAMAEQALVMGGADGLITPARLPETRTRWQQLVPYAAAACLVLGLFLLLGMPDFLLERGETLAFDSPEREQLALTLSDGTLTNLDVDSAVTVNMTAGARAINLVKGRAFFDVAHDSQRPFSVAVGASKVIALGTRFQVQREDRMVIVTLEEGSVDVVSEFEGRTLRERLRPGEQLRFSQDSDRWTKTNVETDTVTSWSRGRHVFRSARLADALEEVNRYAATKVQLGDPALADLMVSGNFMIGDSSMILSAFEAALPIQVVDGGSELLLFPVDDQDEELDPVRVR